MGLIFSAAILLSAALMFIVEPMFAKMVLKLLGGSPSVWNTCLVFYQAALMAGYIYAHLSLKWLGPRRQAVLHVLLMGLAWICLPIGVAAGWTPPAGDNPAAWLLCLLTVSLGLPFLCISASAPVLQTWFSYLGGRSAKDPYFLYAASNLGSLAGLAAYPLLIEPRLALYWQTRWWSIGYGLLMALFVGCAAGVWVAARRRETENPFQARKDAARSKKDADALPESFREPVTIFRRLWWLALALVPSALLMGVTAHIAVDIASVPLLWAIPLALYLLSFIMVFARWPILKWLWLIRIFQAAGLAASAGTVYLGGLSTENVVSVGALHLATFFLTALVCHGAMAADRPASEHLTEFYLWMSAGGVAGGLLCALVAPRVFNTVLEYPLVLIAACLLRPRPGVERSARWLFSFQGRVGRGAFWVIFVCHCATSILVWLTAVGFSFYPDWSLETVLILLTWNVVGLWIGFAIQARRWHDLGYSGWMALINLIPFGSLFCLPVLGLFPGNDGPNAYGERDPLPQEDRHEFLWRLSDLSLMVMQGGVLTFAAVALWNGRLATWAEKLDSPALKSFITDITDSKAKTCWVVVAAILAFLLQRRPAWFTVALASLVGICMLCEDRGEIIHSARSFFGVLRVVKETYTRDDQTFEEHTLMHGSTIHGTQGFAPDDVDQPWTYYHRTGPVGDVFNALYDRNEFPGFTRHGHIGVVGLGTGSTAAYGGKGPDEETEPRQKLTYFEIDSKVRRISEDPKFFTYFTECRKRLGDNLEIRMGDARLTLAREPEGKFDVLLIDAFSSDAIPIHLITCQAVEMYFEKLAPHGLLMVHLSNRHLRLEPVVAATAEKLQLVARVRDDNDETYIGKSALTWAVLRDRRTIWASSRTTRTGKSSSPSPTSRSGPMTIRASSA